MGMSFNTPDGKTKATDCTFTVRGITLRCWEDSLVRTRWAFEEAARTSMHMYLTVRRTSGIPMGLNLVTWISWSPVPTVRPHGNHWPGEKMIRGGIIFGIHFFMSSSCRAFAAAVASHMGAERSKPLGAISRALGLLNTTQKREVPTGAYSGLGQGSTPSASNPCARGVIGKVTRPLLALSETSFIPLATSSGQFMPIASTMVDSGHTPMIS